MLLRNRRVYLAAALVCCSLFVLLLFVSKKQDVARKLRSIPAEERVFLEAFFRDLISMDDGSYVLFGSKPASLMPYAEWEKRDLEFNFRFLSVTDFSPEKKGFEIWQKYQHLFPSKTYVLVKSRFSEYMAALFLIHKQRLFGVLSEHFTDFQEIFPQFGSAKHLLHAMLDDPSILQQICQEHDLLLGIILGFGKENARLFERKMKIAAFLFPRKCGCHASWLRHPFLQPTPSPGFATLEEELEAIELKSDGPIDIENGWGIQWALHFPLGFLVDTTKTDLTKLRAELKQERSKATLAYHKKNFLEVTLQELTRN
jgi:hypothetical protein